MSKQYFVYILSSKNNSTLYIGVTNNLQKRVNEHKDGNGSVFTRRYHIEKLVYFEEFASRLDAISREKQLKGGSRKKKEDLINSMNPVWKDLSEQ